MSVLHSAVHAALAEEPMTAQAIMEKVDGQPSLNLVQYALRDLIAQEKAKRHHSGDGILRYSRVGPAPAAAPMHVAKTMPPAPAPKPETTPSAPASKQMPRTTTALAAKPATVRDDVLAALTVEPQNARAIAVKAGVPDTSARTALKRLRALGLAVLEGSTTNAKWRRASAQAPAAASAKDSTKRTAPPPPGEKSSCAEGIQARLPRRSRAVAERAQGAGVQPRHRARRAGAVRGQRGGRLDLQRPAGRVELRANGARCLRGGW